MQPGRELSQVQQEYLVDVIMTWIQNEMDLHKGEWVHESNNYLCIGAPWKYQKGGGSAAFQSIEEVVKSKQGKVVGKFSCKGYDTFGPFKLIGGIAKGHADDKDLADAVTFYKGIIQK